ncbi:putative pentaxin [Trypoxylus dichotomus]
MKRLICFVSLVIVCKAIESWQPVLEHDIYPKIQLQTAPSFSSLVAQTYQPNQGDQCGLYKVGFSQDLYFQYIQYKTLIPEMKEFTLCYWNKYNNHSTDHPLFSYAVDGQPRAIYSWVSNTERSSYYSLSVEGHTFYRLNYPLRLNRWYHTCQSWNGKTGEWQIWVNAERVGRGFHNRLVGHVIPSGGIAITGQEQTQTGGGFSEGKGAGGMLGEITMVQMYSVALTAGKAHKDHKHHHAHEYDHNGVLLTTTPTPPPNPRPTQPTHPLLTGGQLNPNVALNLALQQTQQQQLLAGQNYNAQLLGAQILPSPQLPIYQFQAPGQQQGPQTFRPPIDQPLLQPQPQPPQLPILPTDITNSIGQQQISFRPTPLINSGLVHPSLVNPANVQIIDTTKFETHQLFKRNNDNKEASSGMTKAIIKRETNSRQKKRELILTNGQLLDDSLLTGAYDQSLLAGLAGIGQNEPILQKQRQMDEREPAEAEVTAVLNICSGCDEEPFGKALIFGWRTVPKKLYSGAFYQPAVPQCRVF